MVDHTLRVGVHPGPHCFFHGLTAQHEPGLLVEIGFVRRVRVAQNGSPPAVESDLSDRPPRHRSGGGAGGGGVRGRAP
ncbi:hypothetical protein HNR12_002744 [Streptomonospora nanhaiensis]|uniref:Uncharacterized protein n=1 Tax=Streptomonospora nanhaiensis TaxID=1323731 RepID=A0A853BPB8_9ACTN|nr:hypothetical protein [Streptomonospora nanhaiensis]